MPEQLDPLERPMPDATPNMRDALGGAVDGGMTGMMFGGLHGAVTGAAVGMVVSTFTAGMKKINEYWGELSKRSRELNETFASVNSTFSGLANQRKWADRANLKRQAESLAPIEEIAQEAQIKRERELTESLAKRKEAWLGWEKAMLQAKISIDQFNVGLQETWNSMAEWVGKQASKIADAKPDLAAAVGAAWEGQKFGRKWGGLFGGEWGKQMGGAVGGAAASAIAWWKGAKDEDTKDADKETLLGRANAINKAKGFDEKSPAAIFGQSNNEELEKEFSSRWFGKAIPDKEPYELKDDRSHRLVPGEGPARIPKDGIREIIGGPKLPEQKLPGPILPHVPKVPKVPAAPKPSDMAIRSSRSASMPVPLRPEDIHTEIRGQQKKRAEQERETDWRRDPLVLQPTPPSVPEVPVSNRDSDAPTVVMHVHIQDTQQLEQAFAIALRRVKDEVSIRTAGAELLELQTLYG